MTIFRWPQSWASVSSAFPRTWGQDPFSMLRAMQREMERLVGHTDAQRVGGGTYPPLNVLNSPDEIIVQCELAGVNKEDLDISITGETLIVKGVKNPPPDEEKIHYQRQERGTGEFSRTVVLPDQVDPEKIDATLVDGILTIRLFKSQAAKPRQISVK